jgi:hypothetical protein
MNVALNRIAVVAAASLMLLAGAAQAGHLERSDLMQIDDTFTDTNQPSGASGDAFLFMSGSDVSGSISMTVTNGTTSGGFGAGIQDFDKATKSKKKSKLRNNNWTWVFAWTYVGSIINTSVGQSSMESCKMQITAKDTDGDLDPDEAKWSMGCNKKILGDLGMSSNAQDRFLALFKEVKPKGTSAKKLSYSGKGPVD